MLKSLRSKKERFSNRRSGKGRGREIDDEEPTKKAEVFPANFRDFKKQQKRKDKDGKTLSGFWWDLREIVDSVNDSVTDTVKGLSTSLPSWLQLPESSSLPSNEDLQIKVGKAMIGGAVVITSAVLISYVSSWLKGSKKSDAVPEKIAPSSGVYTITQDSARARQKQLSRSR